MIGFTIKLNLERSVAVRPRIIIVIIVGFTSWARVKSDRVIRGFDVLGKLKLTVDTAKRVNRVSIFVDHFLVVTIAVRNSDSHRRSGKSVAGLIIVSDNGFKIDRVTGLVERSVGKDKMFDVTIFFDVS